MAHRAWGHSVYLLPLVEGSANDHAIFDDVAERMGAELYAGPPVPARYLTHARLRLVLAEVLRSIGPTWIYAPSAADYSLERRAVHDATMSVAADVPTVYCYRSLSSTAAFVPNHFVEIEEAEKAAILRTLPGVPQRPLEVLPRSPSPSAEAFHVLRTERSLNPTNNGGPDVPRPTAE